jgi:hypothetical protein
VHPCHPSRSTACPSTHSHVALQLFELLRNFTRQMMSAYFCFSRIAMRWLFPCERMPRLLQKRVA